MGIDITIWFDYYKNDKTDFQKICLLGYLAIKNILQKNAYCKISNKYWLSRMDGKSRVINDFNELSKSLQKYVVKYQLRKIKGDLKETGI